MPGPGLSLKENKPIIDLLSGLDTLPDIERRRPSVSMILDLSDLASIFRGGTVGILLKAPAEGCQIIKAGFEDFSHTCEVCSLNPKTVIIKEKLSFYTVLTGSVSHSKPVPKKLFDYYAGINHICRVYGMVDDNQLKKYIRRKVIPDLLKPQLGFCRDADKDIQKEMYRIFANELKDLYNRDLIHISGSGLKKYLIYRYLIAFMAD